MIERRGHVARIDDKVYLFGGVSIPHKPTSRRSEQRLPGPIRRQLDRIPRRTGLASLGPVDSNGKIYVFNCDATIPIDG